ncbi:MULTISPECIES: DUF1090 domain-containing protein [unclassified Achromobacter]|jgi:hypothetical protein|uniref:DUF1090 domain-containing protein n=1 Tax=unclassified Achromobacter TaxID=2626865 RepID=UPI000B5183A1|nr:MULTISPECIES: DUF1090 domain-containing protein [unclassified Achromobacter]OWT68146.1 hypothetical protein CEY05_29395 [Achromobacter sp. HZ34]OWT69983.1 hypothetical protein CEY04_28225 [Achromobacter sp. HZ28]
MQKRAIRNVVSIVALLACAAWLPAQAADPVPQERLRGCAGKKQDIERELRFAQESGNKARVKGLQEALAGADRCTDASLQQEREGKVRDAQAKVKEREDELAEKQAKGKKKDIAKAQRKLDDARADLGAAQAEMYR